jgi:hypothetical protein
MSLQGFQDYTQPLVLNGEVTIKGTLNAKNIYVSGAITGAGISTDILSTDNTWTGTNDFQDVVSYTGVAVVGATDLIQKVDVDNAVAGYNPLNTTNFWSVSPVFSNADPPSVPPFSSGVLNTTDLYSYVSMTNWTGGNPSGLLTTANTLTGTNNFTGTFTGVSTPQLEAPTALNQPASKAYVDAKIEVGGKTLTYTITTSGAYNMSALVNRANIAKVDFWLFGGSCGGFSGAVVSGTIGNGCGLNGSLLLNIGTTADPAVVYTTQDTTTPSTTSFLVSNQLIAGAGGACNLNGALVGGNILTNVYGGANGLYLGGENGNNKLAYSNVLGTSTSAGGAIFVAYFI